MTRKTRYQPALEIVCVTDIAISAESGIDLGAAVLPPRTKADRLRERLEDPGGASLTALMELTGWQAHTIRAALSGLRKTGPTLTRWREDMETFYKADGGDPATGDAAAMAGPEAADTTKPPMAAAAIEAPTSSTPANDAGEVVA